MAQHTSAPWQQYHDEYEPLRIVGNVDGDDRGMLYENIVEEVEGKTREEALANARLIAAAPCLLKALQAALETHGDGYSWGAQAQRAICKAING